MNHGLDETPECDTWRRIKSRCFNPLNKDYVSYGAAGVRVCEFIRHSPRNLISLIGIRPSGLTIDRLDSKGHYSCGKCNECKRNGWQFNIRWATRKEQVRNRLNTVKVNFHGKDVFLMDLSDKYKIHYNTLLRRHASGLMGEDLVKLSRKQNPKYEALGKSMTLKQWSDTTGISLYTLYSRVHKGVLGDELVSSPRGTGRHANSRKK